MRQLNNLFLFSLRSLVKTFFKIFFIYQPLGLLLLSNFCKCIKFTGICCVVMCATREKEWKNRDPNSFHYRPERSSRRQSCLCSVQKVYLRVAGQKSVCSCCWSSTHPLCLLVQRWLGLLPSLCLLHHLEWIPGCIDERGSFCDPLVGCIAKCIEAPTARERIDVSVTFSRFGDSAGWQGQTRSLEAGGSGAWVTVDFYSSISFARWKPRTEGFVMVLC